MTESRGINGDNTHTKRLSESGLTFKRAFEIAQEMKDMQRYIADLGRQKPIRSRKRGSVIDGQVGENDHENKVPAETSGKCWRKP